MTSLPCKAAGLFNVLDEQESLHGDEIGRHIREDGKDTSSELSTNDIVGENVVRKTDLDLHAFNDTRYITGQRPMAAAIPVRPHDLSSNALPVRSGSTGASGLVPATLEPLRNDTRAIAPPPVPPRRPPGLARRTPDGRTEYGANGLTPNGMTRRDVMRIDRIFCVERHRGEAQARENAINAATDARCEVPDDPVPTSVSRVAGDIFDAISAIIRKKDNGNTEKKNDDDSNDDDESGAKNRSSTDSDLEPDDISAPVDTVGRKATREEPMPRVQHYRNAVKDIEVLTDEFDATAARATNIRVRAKRAWNAELSNQISLRKGMVIKQKQAMDEDGMAFGWKRTRAGKKKYGYYPADAVTLYPSRSNYAKLGLIYSRKPKSRSDG